MTNADWHKALLAILLWKEAEGEPLAGKVAVAWVVRNRVLRHVPAGAWTVVMTTRLQFSGLTAPGNPRLIKWPADGEPAWTDCMTVAEGVYDGVVADPTGGATLYYAPASVTPDWDFTKLVKTATIGKQVFYKEV